MKPLSALGLSEKDVRVYLALLKEGPSSVQEVANKTGINRSSMYVVLERLVKLSFVNIDRDKAVRRYVAAAPERLAIAAKEKAERSALLLQNLATFFPTLQSAHVSSRIKPRVEFLDGIAGLQKGFGDALASKDKIMRVFSSTKNIFESLPRYLPIFVQQRLIRGIKMFGIHPDDETSREMVRQIPNSLDDITLIPEQKFKFPSDFGIYDDKVAFMSHSPPFCVLIQSKEISEVMKVAFDLAKVEAKRYDTRL